MKHSEWSVPAIALVLFLSMPGIMEGRGGETPVPIEGFPEASLTLFPITYAITGPIEKHRQFYDGMMGPAGQRYFAVIDTLGNLLAEKGYDRYEIATSSFRFPDGEAGRKDRADVIGRYVREQGLETDYGLWVDTVLHLEQSWQEVYVVLVDRQGRVLWQDRQQRGDPDFDEHLTGGPETVCSLVCERLTPAMALDRLPNAELTEERREALRQMRAEQPPDRDEQDAMAERLEAMSKTGSAVRLAVYPARIQGERTDRASATHITEMLTKATLCSATVAEEEPLLEGAGWPNQAKVLWLFANAAKDHLRKHPSDGDYVLFTDYWMNPRGGVHAVDFVVLDRAGEWVLAELANSHHDDFQEIAPATIAGCDRLVVERLKQHFR